MVLYENAKIMKIRFDEMEMTVLPQFKGGEKEFAANMFFDGTNRIFKGRLIPGATIGMHTHDDSCEVIFILEGSGTMVEVAPQLQPQDMSSAQPQGQSSEAQSSTGLSIQSKRVVMPVSAGDCLYCPKGHSHSLRNTAEEGNLVFYAVVPKQ